MMSNCDGGSCAMLQTALGRIDKIEERVNRHREGNAARDEILKQHEQLLQQLSNKLDQLNYTLEKINKSLSVNNERWKSLRRSQNWLITIIASSLTGFGVYLFQHFVGS
ncbi:hypothetical protein ACQZV8_18825 [Magnetococcales bacterium HHB-1]